tara:strand:+ start:115 stop:627 length:513 start_codon:yes stop_codon:yes gene_type:complete
MSKLVQINKDHVTSDQASVSLTGINQDCVYVVVLSAVTPVSDSQELRMRVTKSGSEDTTSNYDCAANEIKAHTTFGGIARQNDDYFKLDSNTGTATGECINKIVTLYNFYDSSQDSSFSYISSFNNQSTNLYANTGGGVHTVASASDGVHFYFASGDIAKGQFTLYKMED